MENVYIFIKNKDGKIEFSKKELDELLNEVSEKARSKGYTEGYNKGYSEGLSYGRWYSSTPRWNYPYINSDKITISTPSVSPITCKDTNSTITYATSNTGEIKYGSGNNS